MNLSAPFIHRPVMTTFVMLAILIAGIFSFRQLPVSDLPNLEYPQLGVSASYSGASPETMVKMVTKPLEKELANVAGVKEISSITSQGYTTITLKFALSRNLEEASQEVQAAINRADSSLPSDIDEKPTYFKQESSQEHIIYLVLTSPTESVSTLREHADLHIESRLSRIEGVASVDTFGAPYSIKIHVNPDLMASRHLTLDQILKAIKEQNADLPLGVIKTGTKKLSIELPSSLQTAKDFENLVIGEGPIRLKDVAQVIDRSEEDEDEFHYITKDKNMLAMIIGIKKVSGANTVAISHAIRDVLPEITRELPPSMDLKLWFDKALWIHESIVDVQWSLAFAFILVVIVIFFSLGRLSEALIPSIALPMSFIGTFIAMYLLDFSLDILSLLALTLSVGFVVDDAIVVLENIVRHKEKKLSAIEASLVGSKEIGFTVLSMTISLVVVFIPLLFMGGMNGRLFYEFSMTLAIAILISGFISLSLTPMLCSKWLGTHTTPTNFRRKMDGINQTCLTWYGISLKWCLNRQKLILALAFICFAVTVPLFQSLPVDLFPKEDRGFMFTIVKMPKSTSPEKSKEYQKKIETILQTHPAVESVIDLISASSQVFVISLVPNHLRLPQDQVIEEIQDAINAIPGIQGFSIPWQLINMDLDTNNGGDYKYLLRGTDRLEIEKAAEQLKDVLSNEPTFTYVTTDTKNDNPKLIVTVDEEKAQQYGFSTYAIQSLIQKAFSGGKVATIKKNGTQYNVYLSLEKEYRNRPDSLGNLYLTNTVGASIPLKSLVSWKEVLGSPTIYRIDQLPTVTLNFAIDKDIPLNIGLEKLQEIAAKTLPVDVKGRLEGSAAMVATATGDTGLLLLASAVVMYIILGILYESFIHPLTILSSLPFAGLGGILTLLIFHEPLSIYSIVGFLLLIGIVKKNGIMIVDFAIEARKNHAMTPEEAIYEGSLVRFRPIMMTTVAAIMGAVPIAIGFGEGAETRRGLGLVIVGGLLFSQLLILYVTPVIYLTLEKLFSKNKPKASSK